MHIFCLAIAAGISVLYRDFEIASGSIVLLSRGPKG